MRQKLKYFIINKTEDYRRGLYENMEPRGGGLFFSLDKKTGVGSFMTRIFDSGEYDSSWHRLVIGASGCEKEDLKVTVYAAEKNEVSFGGDTMTLYELFEDDRLTLSQKTDAFACFTAKRVSGASDILLHEVRGRYLWVLIEQYSSGGSPAGLSDIMIYLPAVSWIDYLPQIYRSSDGDTHFLERYLAVFQTVYEELDAEIAGMSRRFDPESTDDELLEWLASWLDISDTDMERGKAQTSPSQCGAAVPHKRNKTGTLRADRALYGRKAVYNRGLRAYERHGTASPGRRRLAPEKRRSLYRHRPRKAGT